MPGHTFPPFRSGTAAVAAADSAPAEASCFADEVAVDFPSVARAVDRIRRGFLAEERPLPLEAAVRLSPRDALEGVTLPLAVPVRRTCAGCGGRGESWTEACDRCGGTGTEVLHHHLQVRVPAGVEDGTRVQFILSPPQHPSTRVELRIAVG